MQDDLANNQNLQQQLTQLPQPWQTAVFKQKAVQLELLQAAEGIRGLLEATTTSTNSSASAQQQAAQTAATAAMGDAPFKEVPADVRHFHSFCASQLQQEGLPCHLKAWMVEDLPQRSPLSCALQQLVRKKLLKQFGNLEAVLNNIPLRSWFRELQYSEMLLLLSSEELIAASENTVAAALGLWLQGQAAGALEFDQRRRLVQALRPQHMTPTFVQLLPGLLDGTPYQQLMMEQLGEAMLASALPQEQKQQWQAWQYPHLQQRQHQQQQQQQEGEQQQQQKGQQQQQPQQEGQQQQGQHQSQQQQQEGQHQQQQPRSDEGASSSTSATSHDDDGWGYCGPDQQLPGSLLPPRLGCIPYMGQQLLVNSGFCPMWRGFSNESELPTEGDVEFIPWMLPDRTCPATAHACEHIHNGLRWRLEVGWKGRQEVREGRRMVTGLGHGGVNCSQLRWWDGGTAESGGLVFLDGLESAVECLGLAGDTGEAEVVRPMEVSWVWEALVDDNKAPDGAGSVPSVGWGSAATKKSSSSSSIGSDYFEFYCDSDDDSDDDDWVPPGGEVGSTAETEDAHSSSSSYYEDDKSDADELAVLDEVWFSRDPAPAWEDGYKHFDWGEYSFPPNAREGKTWPDWMCRPPELKCGLVLKRWRGGSSGGGAVVVEDVLGEEKQVQALGQQGSGVWLRCYLSCR